MDKHLERIEREAGIPGLASLLAEKLGPTDLQSLLLEVYRQRSRRRTPADVLSDYETNRFVKPSTSSPQRLLELEQLFLSELPSGVAAMELSPVCPLGTVSAVASVDQNWAVATARNTEVISDTTNVLALECALRRREILRRQPKSPEAAHLAASHRFLRPQFYGSSELLPHFRMFSLCSGGRDRGNLRFEFDNLALHMGFYVGVLQGFLGTSVPLGIYVTDFHTDDRTALIQRALFAPIRDRFPEVGFEFDNERESGRGYYLDLCFHLYARTPASEDVQLADGGSVNWTQRLLSNAKERLIISGISSERICTAFEEQIEIG